MVALASGVCSVGADHTAPIRGPAVGQVVPVDTFGTQPVQVHWLEVAQVDLDRLGEGDVATPAQGSTNDLENWGRFLNRLF